MCIVWPFCLARELGRDGFEDGLVVRIEGIGQMLVGVAVAGLDKLLDGDGRDGGGGDEVDHRLRLADIGRFYVQAPPLARAGKLFDDPAPAEHLAYTVRPG